MEHLSFLDKCRKILVFLVFLPFVRGTETQTTVAVEDSINDDNTNSTVHVFTSNLDGQDIMFRVINGLPAKLGEIPYQVALMKRINLMSRKYVAYCGGSIVGPRKVVTAAHCVQVRKLCEWNRGKRTASDYKSSAVVAGQLNTVAYYGAQGQWRKIQYVKYPPKFKFPRHDIAIIRLDSNFRYNFVVKSINYAKKKVDYGNMICLASGYGRIFEQAKVQSSVLLKAKLKVLSFKQCNMVHNSDYSKLICTSDTISDMRQGDSGGPLVCHNTGDPAEKGSPLGLLVGVVSGKDMARTHSTFFTRISAYHKFVSSSSKISPCLLSIVLTVSIKFYMPQF